MKKYIRTDIMPKTAKKSYEIKTFQQIDAESDESSLPLSYCRYGYNIEMKNGSLMNGIGISTAELDGLTFPLPASNVRIVKCWLYARYDYVNERKDYRILAQLNSYRIMQLRLDGSVEGWTDTTMSVGKNDKVSVVNCHHNGQDVIMLYLSTGGCYRFDGTFAIYSEDSPWISSACRHYGRIYATLSRDNKLSFTSLNHLTNFLVTGSGTESSGGYITFSDEGGAVRRCLPFNDHLFIFRDRAIHRLTAYTDFSEYRLIKVFSTTDTIYPDTVTVCGSRIVFLAGDGLYTFDGYTARKIFSTVFPLIEGKEHAHSCWYNHKYYLACGIKRDEETVGDETQTLKNNGMIIVDFDLNSVSVFRGADIGSLTPIYGENKSILLTAFSSGRQGVGMVDDSGCLFGQPLKKKWTSASTDFGESSRDKILRKVFLRTGRPLKLGINSDGETDFFAVSASQKIQMLPMSKKGERLSLSIETDSERLYLPSLLLEMDVSRKKYF